MRPTKACPVVLRARGDEFEILAFKHPLAGFQLVKGTIEGGESCAEAAMRELKEESGICARAVFDFGLWNTMFEGQVWSLQLCQPLSRPPDTWVFETKDDGGHAFEFAWYPLEQNMPEPSHWLFRSALGEIRGRVAAWTTDMNAIERDSVRDNGLSSRNSR